MIKINVFVFFHLFAQLKLRHRDRNIFEVQIKSLIIFIFLCFQVEMIVVAEEILGKSVKDQSKMFFVFGQFLDYVGSGSMCRLVLNGYRFKVASTVVVLLLHVVIIRTTHPRHFDEKSITIRTKDCLKDFLFDIGDIGNW